MLRTLLVTLWILVLVIITSSFVGAAAQAGKLVLAAPFLPLIPILGLFRLRQKEMLSGWATFTVWLGSTYVGLGTPIELTVFGIIVLLALLGYFRSPWFMVAAWFAHIAWDFVPRTLPPLMADLPPACMIFDGLIGLYLAWLIVTHRWPAVAKSVLTSS